MAMSYADMTQVDGTSPENNSTCPLLLLSKDELESKRLKYWPDGQKFGKDRINYTDPGFLLPFYVEYTKPLKGFSDGGGTTVSIKPESEDHEGSLRHESDKLEKCCHLEWIGYEWKWGDGQLYLTPTTDESQILGECPEGFPFAFQRDVLVKGKYPGFLVIV